MNFGENLSRNHPANSHMKPSRAFLENAHTKQPALKLKSVPFDQDVDRCNNMSKPTVARISCMDTAKFEEAHARRLADAMQTI